MKFAFKTKDQISDDQIERRKIKRFKTELKVFAQGTDELLGYAEDLSIKGLKLRSIAPIIDDGKIIQLWLRTSRDDENENKILLSARKRWGTFTRTDPRIFNSGLDLINLSDEVLDSIQKFTRELSK